MNSLFSYLLPTNGSLYMTKEEQRQTTLEYIGIAVLAALALAFFVIPSFAAGDAQAGQIAIDAIVQIVCQIARVVGIIFIIVGVFKYAVAHSTDNGGDQQKAIMMLATGVVLVIITSIIISIGGKLKGVITTDAP